MSNLDAMFESPSKGKVNVKPVGQGNDKQHVVYRSAFRLLVSLLGEMWRKSGRKGDGGRQVAVGGRRTGSMSTNG